MLDSVLIIDDDPGVRALIARTVADAGYEIDSVGSAEEALEFIKTHKIDVVIADIILPGMNGLDFVERIRKSSDTDVIVVTGYFQDHSYAEAIGKGASDYMVKPVRADELVLRLKRVIEERDLRRARLTMLSELRKMVITDPLTVLYNSRHFFCQVDVEMGRAHRYARPLALMLMDIDNFKSYNDCFGHIVGDQVLARVGEIIRSCLRKTDSAYRYGGEEFTILLPETTADVAVVVAERMRQVIESEIFIPEEKMATTITVSIGVTEYRHPETEATFVHRADMAMYQSKASGRNSVTVLKAEE